MAEQTPREKLEAAKELGIFLRENEHVIRLLENGEITVSKFIETLEIMRAGNIPALPCAPDLSVRIPLTFKPNPTPRISTPPGVHYSGRVNMRPLYAVMTEAQQLRGFYPRKLGDKAPCPLCGVDMTLGIMNGSVSWQHPYDECSRKNRG